MMKPNLSLAICSVIVASTTNAPICFGAARPNVVAIRDGKTALSDEASKHHPLLGTPPDENTTVGWPDEITILQLAAQSAGRQID